MVKLANTPDLGSGAERFKGSSPFSSTMVSGRLSEGLSCRGSQLNNFFK